MHAQENAKAAKDGSILVELVLALPEELEEDGIIAAGRRGASEDTDEEGVL